MAQSGKSNAPPYVSFRTFLSFLDWSNEDGIALPSRLDRSFWGDRLSGSNGPQLMGALRFLGLIDDSNTPQSALERMVEDQTVERERRKAILREQLLKCYAEALDNLDLERVSWDQFRERFVRYSIDGETLRKALAFFIHAAEYCGIALSPYLTKKTRTGKKTNVGKRQPRLAKRRLSEDKLPPDKSTAKVTQGRDLHPSLQGLLEDLVHDGPVWNEGQRDQWVDTFVQTVKYVYPTKRSREVQLDMRLS